MHLEFRKSKLLVPALLTISIGLVGCGGSSGGGGGGGDTSSDGITVLPERFDFGLVTEGNLPDVLPRIFTLSNEGETSYAISNMSLSGTNPDAFGLDENGGDTPCRARALTLAPGDTCTVAVSFEPGLENFGSFSAALLVRTNDPNASSVARSLSGTYAAVEEINVTVNQINACPRSQAAAFVSVTDQAGFPIKDLAAEDFTLEELGRGPVANPGVTPVGQSGTNLALSIVMDFSSSITNFPSAVTNMEEAATQLVKAMQDIDEADVIKYADEVRCMLEANFDCSLEAGITSDQATLSEAIADDPGLISGTAFYDATVTAIERLESRATDRRVVINLTDGEDTASVNASLAATITEALDTDIPIFTVGFGDVDPEVLRQMSAETGGLFYNPAADANLQQVSQQLTNLLFNDQYVITFVSDVPEGESASLLVKADSVKDGTRFEGEGSKTILACP